MTRFKTILAALGAAVVVSAVLAASAAAMPEWGHCEEQAGGKYTDAGCTVRAHPRSGGHYEWRLNGFEVQGEFGPMTFQTPAGNDWQCSGGNIAFGVLPPGEGSATQVILTGCESEGKECQSAFGNSPGEISNTAQLFGGKDILDKLGFLAGKGTGSPTVGLGLTSSEREGIFFTAGCEGGIGTIWVGGEKKGGNTVIGQISPVNQVAESFTLSFAASEPGVQQWKALENSSKERTVKEFIKHKWEQSSWSGELVLTTSEPVEIKATK